MTLLVVNNINLPPSPHTHTHTRSDAPLPLLRVQSQATSPLHQPLTMEAVVSLLCFPFFMCDISPASDSSEWPCHLWPFHSARLWTWVFCEHSCTDVLTDVKMHCIYDASVLIGFQPPMLRAKNTHSPAMKHVGKLLGLVCNKAKQLKVTPSLHSIGYMCIRFEQWLSQDWLLYNILDTTMSETLLCVVYLCRRKQKMTLLIAGKWIKTFIII